MIGSCTDISKSFNRRRCLVMKIGILQADTVLKRFQAEHGDYPEMIISVLSEAASEIGMKVEFINYDVEHGIYPDEIDETDAYIITGSKKSVYDDDAWIQRLKKYTQELHAAKKKLVGICFGHQLVADALGGSTHEAPVGWCVGNHENEIVQSSWFMAEENLKFYSLIVSHKDQVFRLPREAKRLASTKDCPNSMYCIGDHILGIQGHPEFSKKYSRDLIEMRRELLGVETYNVGVESLVKSPMRDVVGRWILRFIKGKPKDN